VGIQRTPDEIRAEVNKVLEWKDANGSRSKFSGMTYEDGVLNALDWVNGDIDDSPMED
jgi:hypothetical protein